MLGPIRRELQFIYGDRATLYFPIHYNDVMKKYHWAIKEKLNVNVQTYYFVKKLLLIQWTSLIASLLAMAALYLLE